MNSGQVLACDAPQKLIVEARGVATLEDAFIGYMEDAIVPAAASAVEKLAPTDAPTATPEPSAQKAALIPLPVRRMFAYSRNEAIQILRDPVRLAFAFVGSAVLMLVFGFGITTDVEHIRYATFDRDQSPESRAYLEQFKASRRYFTATLPVYSDEECLKRIQKDDVSLIVEIKPRFCKDYERNAQPDVFRRASTARCRSRAETVSQYVRGVYNTLADDPGSGLHKGPAPFSANIQERYMYNPTFESIYSIVPSVPAILLILIPAILMTVSIVREKELGSIE